MRASQLDFGEFCDQELRNNQVSAFGQLLLKGHLSYPSQVAIGPLIVEVSQQRMSLHHRIGIDRVVSRMSRLDALDWMHVEEELNAHGCAQLHRLLSESECDALVRMYAREDIYRSRIVMGRYGFGRGEYKYFSYPLPDIVSELRTAAYEYLAPIANRWSQAMSQDARYPATHDAYIQRCHDVGQLRPTPLILEYGKDDYNCLHQDLYGEHVFPLQMAILLSETGLDFTGGEFALTEQRPRMQSRVEVVPLRKGDAVIFAVNHRPVKGGRGVYRVNLRHGVSRLRSGRRHTLGIIFHDAL